MYKIIRPTLFFLLATALWECNTGSRIPSTRTQYKEIYISQFKYSYMRRLLLVGYDHSPEIKKIVSLDHSGFTEPILSMEDDGIIDSLVQRDVSNMKADSIRTSGRLAEGAEGKHVLGLVMVKLKSKFLDSLARARYKLNSFNPDYKIPN